MLKGWELAKCLGSEMQKPSKMDKPSEQLGQMGWEWGLNLGLVEVLMWLQAMNLP